MTTTTAEQCATEQRQPLAAITSRAFGELLLAELNAEIEHGDKVKTAALRAVVRRQFNECSAEAAKLVYQAHGWWREGQSDFNFSDDFEARLPELGPAAVLALTIELAVAEDLSDEQLDEHTMSESTLEVLDAYGIDAGRWWRNAGIVAAARLPREATKQGDD